MVISSDKDGYVVRIINLEESRKLLGSDNDQLKTLTTVLVILIDHQWSLFHLPTFSSHFIVACPCFTSVKYVSLSFATKFVQANTKMKTTSRNTPTIFRKKKYTYIYWRPIIRKGLLLTFCQLDLALWSRIAKDLRWTSSVHWLWVFLNIYIFSVWWSDEWWIAFLQ